MGIGFAPTWLRQVRRSG